MAAMMKRYVTDHCGGTVPSWPRMTIQVDPQIAVKMTNGMATEPAPGSACSSPGVIAGCAFTRLIYPTMGSRDQSIAVARR